MLINFKDLMDICTDDYEEYYIDRHFFNTNNNDICIPLKYEGIYKCIGYVEVWNEVGCIEDKFKMYKPINGGTILYEHN